MLNVIWVAMIVAIYVNNSRLRRKLTEQIDKLRARAPPDLDPKSGYAKHIADLRLMNAVMNSVWAYLSIRLCVGIFGHDTYEIYWWVVLGLTIAVHNLAQVAGKITAQQLEKPDLAPLAPAAGKKAAPNTRPSLSANRIPR